MRRGKGTAELRNDRADRAQVRILIEAGYSDSRIAKETGIGYAHIKRIAAQERESLTAALSGKQP